jgi:hypothetical protein
MENQLPVNPENTYQPVILPVEKTNPPAGVDKKYHWIIVFGLILIVLIVSGIYLIFKPISGVPQITVSPEPTVHIMPSSADPKEIIPLKIFTTDIRPDKIVLTSGNPAPCQPEFFDPKTSKFTKIKIKGTPTEAYQIPGQAEGETMMINGWNYEGENIIQLPAPYKVTVYSFGCASEFSYLLDLSKNEARQALYTHITKYSFSEDGKYLYLVNNVNNQGKWTLHRRIINLETKAISEIPGIECVSKLDGFWQNDRLLTYSQRSDRTDYPTDICVWDTSGKLLSRIGTASVWGAANRDYLAEKIGLLPDDANIFYAYTAKDASACALFLADTVSSQIRSFDLLNKSAYPNGYYCASPEVDFDFSGFRFDSKTLRYRIETGRLPDNRIRWGTWRELTKFQE